jgi:hypothetical protein
MCSIPGSSFEYKQNKTDQILCEIGKVLQAAVINSNFRENLLNNPVKSIKNGYFGELFHLPVELLEKISIIRCKTLDQFSKEILNMYNHTEIPELVETI